MYSSGESIRISGGLGGAALRNARHVTGKGPRMFMQVNLNEIPNNREYGFRNGHFW